MNMGFVTISTLKDGSSVQGRLIAPVLKIIEAIEKECPGDLRKLLQQCRRPTEILKFDSDAVWKYGLINEDDTIHESIQKIVLNCLEEENRYGLVKIVNPYRSDSSVRYIPPYERPGSNYHSPFELEGIARDLK